MKTIIFTAAIISGFVFTAGAQTWGEWFKQKSTQRKYLLEQIAALKVYTGYLKEGYNVAKEGTRLIGDIKDGDFGLHKHYFNSLKSVNPAIRNQDKVERILAMQYDMSRLRRQLTKHADQSNWLSIEERRLIGRRCADLAAEASKDLDELELLIKDGRLELTDDERIAGIDKLYQSMQKKYALQIRLQGSVLALCEARQRQANDLHILRSLTGER